jgi:hypothetical protein
VIAILKRKQLGSCRRGFVQCPRRTRLDRHSRISSSDRIAAGRRSQVRGAGSPGDARGPRPKGTPRPRCSSRARMARDLRHTPAGSAKRQNRATTRRISCRDHQIGTAGAQCRDPPVAQTTSRDDARRIVRDRCT